MKKIILALAVLAVAGVSSVAKADWVNGYVRGNGTYVQPYYRSHPDGNPYNNFGPQSKLENSDINKSPFNPVSFSPNQVS